MERSASEWAAKAKLKLWQSSSELVVEQLFNKEAVTATGHLKPA